MGWKDLLNEEVTPVGRSVLLTTLDLQEPYNIVDVVMAAAGGGDLMESISNIGDVVRGRGLGESAFREVKAALKDEATKLGCDAVIGVSINYNRQGTGFTLTGTGTAVRTHRKRDAAVLEKKVQEAAPINPGQLLVKAGLPQYIATFSQRGIRSEKVPRLVEADLITIGIKDPMHRKQILDAIRVIVKEKG